MKIKKIIAGAAILLAVTSSVFAAKAKKSDKNNGKIKVVTTIFPEYDWVREILGEKSENVELTLLLGNGVDLHSYQPTIKDIAKISTSDIFIYVGGESDEWVDDVLANATNKNMKVINLLEVLGDKIKTEEFKEGMQAEEEEHEHHHHDHDEEITENDILPREVSEFSGEWQSLYPVLMTGALDEYVEFQAEKKSIPVEDSRAEIEAKWNCGVKTIKIKGNKITLIYDNGKKESGKYKYAGFVTKKNDEGKISSIRHKFELTSGNGPKYVMLNDHGHKPVKSVEHFHIYFGNNNFDELVTTKSNPFFVDSKLDPEGCLENVMGHEKEHEHEAEGHHHHDEEEEEYDEHVWLSLRNTKVICTEIANALCEKDSANADIYKANLAAYSAKLDALDAKYADVVKAGNKKTVLFGDRFPFRYLVDDYGLDYFAAFVGCSAETEASFETVIFLAKKVDELGLNAVLKIESGDGKIARTIIENSKNKKAKILTLDSIQSTTAKQAASGTTYLKIMEENLNVLEKALK